jgi:hypothetical protein
VETLCIVLNTEGNVPRVVVYDTIAFLGLFGFSEMCCVAQHYTLLTPKSDQTQRLLEIDIGL